AVRVDSRGEFLPRKHGLFADSAQSLGRIFSPSLYQLSYLSSVIGGGLARSYPQGESTPTFLRIPRADSKASPTSALRISAFVSCRQAIAIEKAAICLAAQ